MIEWIVGALRIGFFGLVIFLGGLAVHWVFTTDIKKGQE